MTVTVHRAPWVVPVATAPLRDGEIAVRAGRITAVGRGLSGDTYVDHDAVLAPGLINAHTHLQYGPSFADLATCGLPFAQWLPEITRRRHLLSDPQWLHEAQASARLALSTGTTAVADIVTNPVAAPGRHPLRGISYLESVGVDDRVWAATEHARLVSVLSESTAGVGLSPHTPYTVGTKVFGEIVTLARQRGLRLHPHLAESAAESEFVATGAGPLRAMLDSHGLRMELAAAASGRSPTAYLDGIGALGPDVHVAHGVHVDADDRKILRRSGCAVALCTRSNAILAAGPAPVAAYRAEGNPVAVGTDALSSTPDLDLLAELRALYDLARSQGSDPGGLHEWLVRAATAGGAYALGDSDIGVLAEGAHADFVLVDGEAAADPYETVVRGRAATTYLGGEKVYG